MKLVGMVSCTGPDGWLAAMSYALSKNQAMRPGSLTSIEYLVMHFTTSAWGNSLKPMLSKLWELLEMPMKTTGSPAKWASATAET